LEGLGIKNLVYFGGPWNGKCWYFMVIWYFGCLFFIFRSFSIFVVIFIDFSPFWYFVPRKIWQPFETSYVYVERMYLHTFIQMSLLHSQTLKAAKGFDSFLIFWIIRFHFSPKLKFFWFCILNRGVRFPNKSRSSISNPLRWIFHLFEDFQVRGNLTSKSLFDCIKN
jgi:hypothetical protein